MLRNLILFVGVLAVYGQQSCSSDAHCPASQYCRSNRCTTFAQLGDDCGLVSMQTTKCAPGLRCQLKNLLLGVCVVDIPCPNGEERTVCPMELCTSDMSCPADSTAKCFTDSCGYCAAKWVSAEGTPIENCGCGSNADCADSEYCNGEHTCTPYAREGENCASSVCAPGLVCDDSTQQCSSTQCSSTAPCPHDQYCSQGVCTSYAGEGQSCGGASGKLCQPGLECQNEFLGQPGTCAKGSHSSPESSPEESSPETSSPEESSPEESSPETSSPETSSSETSSPEESPETSSPEESPSSPEESSPEPSPSSPEESSPETSSPSSPEESSPSSPEESSPSSPEESSPSSPEESSPSSPEESSPETSSPEPSPETSSPSSPSSPEESSPEESSPSSPEESSPETSSPEESSPETSSPSSPSSPEESSPDTSSPSSPEESSPETSSPEESSPEESSPSSPETSSPETSPTSPSSPETSSPESSSPTGPAGGECAHCSETEFCDDTYYPPQCVARSDVGEPCGGHVAHPKQCLLKLHCKINPIIPELEGLCATACGKTKKVQLQMKP